jgi:predicted NUDIX family NTP pyrophosphohydrolase
LGQVRQAAGKLVDAFALEGDLDAEGISSTMFEMEWPPKSGTVRAFPEVDRAAWFSLDEAREKMLASQQPLLEQLERQLIG